MKNSTQEVQAWLETKDFEQGILILSKHRAPMARILKLRGPRHISKLEYELKKIAGIYKIQSVVKPASKTKNQPIQKKTPPPPTNKVKSAKQGVNPKTNVNELTGNIPKQKEAQTGKQDIHKDTITSFSLSNAHESLNNVPPEIDKISKEHARLFILRSQLADQRYSLPKTNDASIVKQRKILTQSIHELSDRIETLFSAHSAYMRNRTMPDMESLFPNEYKKAEYPPANETEALILDLKKKRTSLMSQNRRDRLILNYSQPKQLKNKKPLPEGPEKTKVENRVLSRQKQIEQIEIEIKKLTS